jgi:hypothetical protein
MHALLNDNGEDDLLCVQEPWFNPVGTARCDDMIQGKDVLGGRRIPSGDSPTPPSLTANAPRL